ncbi:alpha/beta hydrolase [bacterium J17]|nr:alpha/beta hydrolase [bacterium J17]
MNDSSGYRGLLFPGAGHFQTIAPAFLRRVPLPPYQRERISTPDDDFLDLDWLKVGGKSLVIVLHGLEGSTSSTYIRGMCRALTTYGLDVLAWNLRSCSGEINRALRFYHSGETSDMSVVIDHVLRTSDYQKIALIGYSAGGNITLKYLGELGDAVSDRIVTALTFSVPCDLRASSEELAKLHKRFYTQWFLKDLRQKVRLKMELWPGELDDHGMDKMSTFREFDDRYTAPLHGFRDAEDYWARASSKPWLPSIRIPTLLINAADDPFLARECYPFQEAESSSFFSLEVPRRGGHVGFISLNKNSLFWSERRALEYLGEYLEFSSFNPQ